MTIKSSISLRDDQYRFAKTLVEGGRFPSVSVRTLFSRSVLTIEQHPFGLWVVELRYAPAPDAAAVRWVNEIFRSHFPEDLPVDLIGSNVLQGGHTAAIELDDQEARGEIDRFVIAARLALAPCEPGTTQRLRSYVERFADDGEMLGGLWLSLKVAFFTATSSLVLGTLAAFALRGYKVTLLPMVMHTVCFWGIGLSGGYWLSFHAPWRAGAPSVSPARRPPAWAPHRSRSR